jgi:hypothetical protein
MKTNYLHVTEHSYSLLPPSTSVLPILLVRYTKIFADNTSVILSSKNFDDFCAIPNKVLSHVSKWFTANKLAQNLDKTNIIKFIKDNTPQYALSIGFLESI